MNVTEAAVPAIVEPAAMPELTSEYPIAVEALEEFNREGFVILRNVLEPDEVGPCRDALAGTVERFNWQRKPLEERDSYGKAFLQITNLWQKDPASAKYTLARRFGKIAADLLGVPAVRLWHDQALFKEPGGGPTHWHQDHHYWPLDKDMVVLWMPLVGMTPDMGALTYATGSQYEGHVAQLEISEESEEFFDAHVKQRGYRLSTTGSMAAGDAIFHNAWTLHKALGNETGAMREVMTIIYFPDGARVLTPENAPQEDDLRAWLPGCQPGDLAASPLNPLIYSAGSD